MRATLVRLACLLIFVFSSVDTFPDPSTEGWLAYYRDPVDESSTGNSLAVDDQGNVFVTGESKASCGPWCALFSMCYPCYGTLKNPHKICMDRDADGDDGNSSPECSPLGWDCEDANLNVYPTNPNAYCNCEGPYRHGVYEYSILCKDGEGNDCDGWWMETILTVPRVMPHPQTPKPPHTEQALGLRQAC